MRKTRRRSMRKRARKRIKFREREAVKLLLRRRSLFLHLRRRRFFTCNNKPCSFPSFFMAPPANAMEHNTNLSKVTVVGSGNWGSVAAKLIASNTLKFASFHDEVRMWVYEETLPSGEKLIDVINRTNENVKYLPGIKLGKNVIADPDLENAEWDPWGVPEDYSVNISRMMLQCQSIYIDSSTWSSP